ncbi:acetate--CoA ligase family protein [Nonomuraea harbinensis]|uniref:Acetate--CoA ligase family protein n=1 Tax=Nonomuraea harbinensis TaxID=1286938 RepID=A0ABW1BL37_9ACTN|nr:acetate--CoA ligase family protein [Nonomuraea harbinensis]
MTGGGLEALLDPRSVAVLGASESASRIGGRVLEHLRTKFGGAVFPVNPRRDTVQGLPARARVGDVEEDVDLAVIAVASHLVPEAARQCAERGVRAAVVISSGFAEIGTEAGRKLQDELAAVGRDSGMRILGPNSMGSINLTNGLYATFASLRGFPIATGGVAVVSQSGAFGIRVFEGAQTEGLGLSHMVLTGNEADVTLGEVAGHLVERDQVAALALFAEGVREPELLLAAGRRAAELGKPVVFLKAGVSATGGRAALSHTGSMMVGARAFRAAAESAGIMVVPTLRELLALVKALASGRLPAGRRTCVLTGSGGAGILMADHLEAAGLELPPPSPELRAEVESLIPSFGSAGNPIDFTGQALNDPGSVPPLLARVSAADEYDIVCMTGVNRTHPPEVLSAIVEACRASDKPFLTWTPQADVALTMTRAGAPGFLDAEAMAAAAAVLTRYAALRESALARADGPGAAAGARLVPAGAGTLTESAAKQVLGAYGIPVTEEGVAASADEAAALAGRIGFPVALKLSSSALAHKSDAGAVRLGLPDEAAVRAAFRELAELARGLLPGERVEVLVQEMVPAGIEILCGMAKDPLFGPVITVGAGGTLAEILAERHDALPPVTLARARDLVGGLWGGRLVRHPRGLTPAAAEELAAVVERFGRLAAAETAISEIDVNPLIVTGDRVVAVDALIVSVEAT